MRNEEVTRTTQQGFERQVCAALIGEWTVAEGVVGSPVAGAQLND